MMKFFFFAAACTVVVPLMLTAFAALVMVPEEIDHRGEPDHWVNKIATPLFTVMLSGFGLSLLLFAAGVLCYFYSVLWPA